VYLYDKKIALTDLSVSYDYDELNRVTKITDALNGETRITYDLAGKRLTGTDAQQKTWSFGYDRLNRLTTKLDSRGNKTLAFSYDKVGNILAKTTYQDSTTSYTYNAANRLVMLSNPDYTQVDYQYDPAGRLLSRVSANGARMSQQFDANGWLAKLSQFDAANALISETTYTRDRVGNITTQVDAAGTTSSTAFAMDALYRLTQADYPGSANDELFSYDKVGNRKTTTKGSLSQNTNTRHYNYSAGSNRLQDIRIGSAVGTLESSFTNDLEGRLTSQTGLGAKTLSWDAKGRVKTVGAETYSYDPMDYRIGRSGGSLGNRSYYLEGEHLESEYSGSQLQAKYFRGSSTDELVAAWMVDSDGKLKPYLFHQDQVTSNTAVSGHNGGTTQSVKYQAFGQTQSTTGASPSRLKYTGREDDSTGLYYYRARYYDPQIGRFVSEDPLGFGAGDVNFYQYTSNNPVNANDPSGNVLNFAIGAGVNVLVGGAIRGLTGGNIFDPGAIALDAAIGVATSGLGVIAQIRNTSAIVNAARVEGRVVGNAQSTGTYLHAAASEQQAANLLGQGAQKVYFDRALSTVTGVEGGFSPNVRPDVSASFGGGNLSIVEVVSKTQTSAQMLAKNTRAVSQLEQRGFSATDSFVDAFSFASPFGGTIGVANLGMDAVGAGVTFGGQAVYQGGMSAGGGFLLYPNKSNTNTMQLVYRK
jgi:RHS repeat-associated protein